MTAPIAPGGLKLTEEQIARMAVGDLAVGPGLVKHLLSDWCTLRAERDAKDAEIARLKEEHARLEAAGRATKASASMCWGALKSAEARLAAMATVTEAEARQALRLYLRPGRYDDDSEYCNAQLLPKMRAALEAFVANKTAGGNMSVSTIPDVSDETQAILDGLKKEFGVSTNTEVLNEALRRAKRTAYGLAEITLLPTTPARQSPDQACGAESDAAFVERILGRITLCELVELSEMKQFAAMVRIGASRPAPAPADAVAVLVEALEHLQSNPDQSYTLTKNGHERIAAALSDPRVIAAQSADPWCYDISKAPKDGTGIDLYLMNDRGEVYREPHARWMKPDHTCGEAGQYCDCCPPEMAWCDGFSMWIQDEVFAWAPIALPAAPARQQEEPA